MNQSDAQLERSPRPLWSSPISPSELAGAFRLLDVGWSHDGKAILWLEGRSSRNVLVYQSADGRIQRDLTGELSVRSRVGYGGGEWTVSGGQAFFVVDSKIYQLEIDSGTARKLPSPPGPPASPSVSPDGRLLLAIFSTDEKDGIALLTLEGNAGENGAEWQVLHEEFDFYMQPAWAPEGDEICWIAWNHPNMPWDGTGLYRGRLVLSEDKASLKDVRCLRGSPDGTVALFQPEFSPHYGKLISVISSESGWSNLMLLDPRSGESVVQFQEEKEHAPPAWVQGMRSYGWAPEGADLWLLRLHTGFTSLGRCSLERQRIESIEVGNSDYTDLRQISVSSRGELALIASGPGRPAEVISVAPNGSVRTHRRSLARSVPSAYVSQPEPLVCRTEHSNCHVLYYPPAHPEQQSAEPPPLLIKVHGGPTHQYYAKYDLDTLFFTSRGIAVGALNYRGSSGYGTAFQRELEQRWGQADVQDVFACAETLIKDGKADSRRIFVAGGSAGGLTALLCLARRPGFLAAAIVRYAVTDLEALARETHKFEEYYLERLVGDPESHRKRYLERSPLHLADRIRDPVAIFQGDKDKVVPRSQSDRLVESLKEREVFHIYHVFEDEGHGFKNRANIETYYSEVERFLQHILAPKSGPGS